MSARKTKDRRTNIKTQNPPVATGGFCVARHFRYTTGRSLPMERDRDMENRPEDRPAGKQCGDGVLSLAFGGCRGIVGWSLIRYPIFFPKPAPKIDDPAPARAERIVWVILPVSWHRSIANRTPHFIHRFAPSRTSGIPGITHTTHSGVVRRS